MSMLSVIYLSVVTSPITLSVVMLSVVTRPITLSVVMLSVVMQNVVAPNHLWLSTNGPA